MLYIQVFFLSVWNLVNFQGQFLERCLNVRRLIFLVEQLVTWSYICRLFFFLNPASILSTIQRSRSCVIWLVCFVFFSLAWQPEKEVMYRVRKIPSLVDLCVNKAIDNLRFLGDVGETDIHLLERILPHCTVEQLMHVEKSSEVRLDGFASYLTIWFCFTIYAKLSMNFF